MGFYQTRILPKFLDKMSDTPEMGVLRREVLASARSRVLEIGFGTGLNAPYYPPDVAHVVGLDPNPGVEPLARQRIDAAPVPIEFRLAAGEALPFEDRTFDTVVTTFVLCSVSDPERTLSEIRRVLSPGGRYLLLEHGLSDDVGIQKWQRRLNPLNRAILGGCNLDRPISELMTRAGFRFEQVRRFYMDAAPRFVGYVTLGSAEPTVLGHPHESH